MFELIAFVFCLVSLVALRPFLPVLCRLYLKRNLPRGSKRKSNNSVKITIVKVVTDSIMLSLTPPLLFCRL